MNIESKESLDVNLSPEDERNIDIESGKVASTGVAQSKYAGCRWIIAFGIVALVAVVIIVVVSTDTPPITCCTPLRTSNLPRPVIIDEDYGAFADDIFALSLALELKDVMSVKAAVATSMDPYASALCLAEHLLAANRTDVTVIVGKDIHDAPFRAGIWIPEDLVGFPLREKCGSPPQYVNPINSSAIKANNLGKMEDLSSLIINSDRDDWAYISLGGMTTIAELAKEYPEAVAKISDMIVMGANICDGMIIYGNLMAPVPETNVACDPTAANFVFSKDGPGKNLYVMPVGPGQDTLHGEPYQRIIRAAKSGTCPGASALLDFYFEWSNQARANEDILTHGEAILHDPKESSALRYDPTCILFAAQLMTEDELLDDYVKHLEFAGLWFDDDAYTHIPSDVIIEDPVSDTCPTITDLRFDLDNITDRRSLIAAIGYKDSKSRYEFLNAMANALSCARFL